MGCVLSMALIPGMENINWAGGFASAAYWVFYGLLALMLLFGFLMVYYFISYNYKVDVYPMYGSGKDGVFSVGKRKKNRVKWNKAKNGWKKLWPLLNRKSIEPFDDEFIYPGKKIIAFELNQQWFPGRINITQSENEIRGEICPVPYWVRNWQALEYKQNSMDFAKHDFWNDNKNFIWMLLAVGICCALCGVTIWLTYKFAGGGVGAMDRLTSALQGFGGVSAGAPAG